MGIRYEQDLTRDFDGRIDPRGALAVGELGLVPTGMLLNRGQKISKALRVVGKKPIDMSEKELGDTVALTDEQHDIGVELRRRSPKNVNRKRWYHSFKPGHVPGLHVRFDATEEAGL